MNAPRIVQADLGDAQHQAAVLDAYYALQHHYGVPKAAARLMLRRFVESGAVRLEPSGSMNALTATGGAGLVDRFIHARHRDIGAISLTFERQVGRLEGAVRLRAR